jgi:protein-L-isoaspartate(D-aspartate) O-methyltransferase
MHGWHPGELCWQRLGDARRLMVTKGPPRFPARLDHNAPALHRPQRAVQAAVPAGSTVRSSGIGLDSQAMRDRMVRGLRQEGITDERVLQAMAAVERHRFVDPALAGQAYEDTSLPIGLGQTISKPSVVARMIELALQAPDRTSAKPLARTLEIGTGCGYQAAVLCQLARHVVSVERLRPLFDKASATLHELRLDRLRLVYGDGRLGHPPNAPYDTILCAAGGDDIPQAWLDQLAIGGRLVAPTHQATGQAQVLVTVDRTAAGWSRQSHEIVHFVPLRSGIA